jgi:hypothetical protein
MPVSDLRHICNPFCNARYHHSATSTDCTLDGAGLGGHPSPAGSYLIACVMVGATLQQSVVGIEWAPPGVSPEYRDFLQRVAHEAVFGGKVGSVAL